MKAPLFLSAVIAVLSLNSASYAASPLSTSLKNCLATSSLDPKIVETRTNGLKQKEVVRTKLDAKLASGAKAIKSKTLSHAGKDNNSEVQMITLSYKNEKVAKEMEERLSKSDGYLHNTKILTPYTYGRFDEKIVIVYTEQSEDKATVECLKIIPALTAGGVKGE